MNKKSQSGISLVGKFVLLITVLVIIVVGFGNLLWKTGSEAPDIIRQVPEDFQPWHATSLVEDTVEDSVNALICGIKATAKIDEEIKAKPDQYWQYNTMENFFNDMDWSNFWSVCSGGKQYSQLKGLCCQISIGNDFQYYYVSDKEECEILKVEVGGDDTEILGSNEKCEEEAEKWGELCRSHYGVCKQDLTQEKAHYPNADADSGNEGRCPTTYPYCELQCPDEWGNDCNPDNPDDKKCGGLFNKYKQQYCMDSGYWCENQCPKYVNSKSTDGCTEIDDEVWCTIDKDNHVDPESEIESIIMEYAELQNSFESCINGYIYGLSCVQCYTENGDFKCKVNNFYLPQTGIDDTSTLEQWIAGFGDPEYVLYYEKFPEGYDRNWQADAFSFAPVIMYGSALATFFLPMADDLKDAIKAADKADDLLDALRTGTRATSAGKAVSFLQRLRGMTKWFGAETIESTVKKGAIMETLLSSDNIFFDPNTIDDKMEVISKHITSQSVQDEPRLIAELTDLFKKDMDLYDYEILGDVATKQRLDNQLDPIIKKLDHLPPDQARTLAKIELSEIIATDFVNNIKPILSESSSTTLKSLFSMQRMKRGTIGFLRSTFKDNSFSDDALQEYLKAHAKNFEAIDALVDSGKLSPKQLNSILVNLDQVTMGADKIRQLTLGQKILQGELDAITKALDQNAYDATADKVALLYQKAKKVPLVGLGLTATEWAGKLGTLTLATPERRFFTWAAVSYFGIMYDGINQKFEAQGVNALVLATPSFFGGGTTLDLGKDIQSYAIVLKDDLEDLSRLYLVSPCKADISIQTTAITMELKEDSINKYHLYDFGKGLTPVEKGSIAYESGGLKCCELITKYGQRVYKKGVDCDSFVINSLLYEAASVVDLGLCSHDTNVNLITEAEEHFNNQEYKESLIKYLQFLEQNPDSERIEEVNSKIDSILMDENIFTKIPPKELLDIAFTELVDWDTRSEYYSKFSFSYFDDNCDTPEQYKAESLSRLYGCEYMAVASIHYNLEEQYRKDILQNALGWTEEEAWEYTWEYLLNKDKLVIDYQLALLYVLKEYIIDTYQFHPPSTIVLSPTPTFLEEYNELTIPYEKQEFIRSHLQWGGQYGDTLDLYVFNSFLLGNFPIPKHLFYAKEPYLATEVPWIMNFKEYDERIIKLGRELRQDTNYDDDNYPQLIQKREYYEWYSTIASGRGFDKPEGDVTEWKKISKEIQERFPEKIETSKAVKMIDIEDVVDPSDFSVDGQYFDFAAISVDLELEEASRAEERNYCYHSSSPVIKTLRSVVTTAGFFMDEVIGGLAGAACSYAFTPAAGGWCYRGAATVTNVGFGYLEQKIGEMVFWPKHPI